MMELEVGEQLINRTLMELNLPQRVGVQVVLIRRQKKSIFPVSATDRLLRDDVLVCIGTAEVLTRFAETMES